MMLVVYALWDDDAIHGRPHCATYIQRAADKIRGWVHPPLSPTIMQERLDRKLRLLLDIDGPKYVTVDMLQEHPVRCVGYTYYTMEFGKELFAQSLLARSSINATVSAMAEVVVGKGCEVSIAPPHPYPLTNPPLAE